MGDFAGYQVRYDKSTSELTKIKIMTDGILFNELCQDPMLSEYEYIIIDEAHERKLFSDLLISLIVKILIRRRGAGCFNLKLIVMSATINTQEFFRNKAIWAQDIPVLKIESRRFPIKIFYKKQTPPDYLAACLKKAEKLS